MADAIDILLGIQSRLDSTDRISDLTGGAGLLQGLTPPRSGNLIPRAPVRPSIFGEFTAGLQSGVKQLGANFTSAGAVGLGLFGAEDESVRLIRLAQETILEAEQGFPRTINRIEDVESIEDFVRWAARTLGEQIPNLASIQYGS